MELIQSVCSVAGFVSLAGRLAAVVPVRAADEGAALPADLVLP